LVHRPPPGHSRSCTRVHYTRRVSRETSARRIVEGTATAVQQRRPSPEEGLLRAAFRDLHGARLHGFAMLITLGDRQLAESLAADALAEGARRADTLRHPDRGAAWLRGHVIRALRRRRMRGAGPTQEERRAALASIGVDAAAYDSLRALDAGHRIALVAGWIEALDARDVEGLLHSRPAVLARILASSRHQFLEAYQRASPDPAPLPMDPAAAGPLARRIRAIAAQTMALAGSTA
jgi:hypothetical protein